MKRMEAIAYASSFMPFLLNSNGAEKIDSVILFGSVARGDFDTKSDVDIFIDSRKNLGKMPERALAAFKASQEKKKWELKGITSQISLKSGNLRKWSLRRDVISSGITLYGKYSVTEGSYYSIFTLSFAKMERKEKVRLWRKLYGYAQNFGKKQYSKEGIVTALGGRKLDQGVVAIPASRKAEFSKLLRTNKVSYKTYEAWSDSF